ncbi:MAG: SDR family oxidoreductase [bacterium]|nr:SDR family oxidoreductase [bacterium]
MNYELDQKIAVVTGGGGAICGEIANALAGEGVRVAIWDLNKTLAENKADEIRATGGKALAIECDVTQRESVAAAVQLTLDAYATIDLLINGAGGGLKNATTSPEKSFFDLIPEDMAGGFSLNYMSAVLPSQGVGRIFVKKKSGVILNITSIAGILPLTRSIAYSDAKAAANSFTRWLAVHMAQTYSENIRVNAIAPGFMLTAQNRFLLIDETTGQTTERGRQIIQSVPMARYGRPQEIIGAALWLLSEQASFVTGAVIPVDGGLTAFSGV